MKRKFLVLFPCLLLGFYETCAQNEYGQQAIKGGNHSGLIKDLVVPDGALNFLVIGDWGRCGEDYQKEVGEQLSNASASADASFIISTGDNFYPSGVASTEDPLWNKSYENIYSQFSLQKEWYVVLGNHDYKTNPQAEVEYSKKSARWKMPSRYYSVKVPVDGDTNTRVLFVFLDTNPLIDKYYADPVYNKMVADQDTLAQRKWFQEVLAENDPTVKWKFVIGHHPLYTSGKRFKSIETLQFRKLMESSFRKYAVDAYICGHEHQLEHIKPAGQTHHFISGAGSEAREVKAELPESVFKASDHGFMLFSITKSKFKVQAINWQGKVLYQKIIDKNSR